MNNILIIDDDKELCDLIKKCVQQENMTSLIAYNGYDGLSELRKTASTLALVILDIMLPDIDGYKVLHEIRKISNVPVLMLTAKNDEDDKVAGLRLGADDYLTKPFSINELLARVNSLVRRYTALNLTDIADRIIIKNMMIDKANRAVHIDETQIELTSKEFDLLYFLASNKGRVFTKKQIYTHVWEEEYAFDDSNIMSFISKLRKKIEPDPENPSFILTVRGVGYRFCKEV